MKNFKELENCVELSSSVKIYVPSTTSIDIVTDNIEWVNKGLKLLSSLFGGSTSSKALGAWKSTNGDLVQEDITLVFSFCKDKDLQAGFKQIYSFCKEMKEELSQESIALEVNNKLYLI